MSEYAIIFQVLGAVLALFFIFLTYMSAKTWRWVHVTFLFLTFVASIVFCLYAAMTLKTRANWIKLHDSLEKQLATTEEDLERTTRGDPKDFEGKTDSLFSVRENLARTILDRGRVWRGCLAQINRQTGAILVQTSPPPDPANPTPAPPKKHNIQAKTVVHAFREAQKSPESPTVPAAYIGEFRATPVNDQVVGLEPTMPLTLEQTNAGLAQGTWALYEVMPVDGHDWFEGEEAERVGPLQDAAGLERFANSQQLQQFVSQIATPYLKDNKEADPTLDPPENIWYEVTFLQEYNVDVDAPVVNSIDAEPFNTEGQAVLPRLRRHGVAPPQPSAEQPGADQPGTDQAGAAQAGKVLFGPKEGQIHTAILDQQTAESLIERGICDPKVKKIYRRKLSDYERRFRAINDRVSELNGRIAQISLDDKAMQAATAKAEEQRVLIDELKAKVNDDLAKVKYEVAEMEKYTSALSGRLTSVQNELSQLYRANKAIGRELADLTARLTEEINRRSQGATASVP
jgi:hypothetical protein